MVVAHLSGVLPQRRLGVGFRSLGSLPEPAAEPGLTVAEVDAAFSRLAATAGAGSTASRRAELAALMGRATADEQRFLVDLITGNLRQGALDGVVLAAVAKAYAVPDAASCAAPRCSPAPPPRWPGSPPPVGRRRSSRSGSSSGGRCARCSPPRPRPPTRR